VFLQGFAELEQTAGGWFGFVLTICSVFEEFTFGLARPPPHRILHCRQRSQEDQERHTDAYRQYSDAALGGPSPNPPR